MISALRRLAPLLVLLATACAGKGPPGPQHASFPAGQRVTRSDELVLELSEARYDLQEVALTVSLTNEGPGSLKLDRQGVLLAYGELEFPVAEGPAAEGFATLDEQTALAPGEMQLKLRFVIEQPLLEAGTLHLISIRRDDDSWLAPLRLAVPPPAAFVDAVEPEGDAG